MWLIVASLALGIFAGSRGLVPQWITARLTPILTATLFIMLSALGAQIGANRELMVNLPMIGMRAFAIAALAVAGSVGALYLTVRLIGLEKVKGE